MLLFAIVAGTVLSPAGDSLPQGEYVELHSCEVYTGGCTASAQATQGGRSLLRIWNFNSGWVGQEDLAGLTVAVLEVADANLAMPDTTAKTAVAYLPKEINDSKRAALVEWLGKNGIFVGQTFERPLAYTREGHAISFHAGKDIGFSTRKIEDCDAGTCGEQLWYSPRGKTGAFTVLVNERSHVDEPSLKLSWKDHSSKSVFFGRFGPAEVPTFFQASLN